ncbi:alpha/beta fold hydrolase [Pseudalkalibacillus caeni]|uniref:Alpha/beta hydrolase n=1 Tax=Exobacillus caeni TaxID=2574798 RepID=A0A5R9EXE6_9BACL|nr:alpha/beta hydrolase [Pseudalkalibacillus caeni]TLS35219.1 alpha/beta hydrolase [Pseudalkalibacillus caeni]
MEKWDQQIVKTDRGCFEIFTKGKGDPVCVSHHYSQFNASGDHFAGQFLPGYKVYLVNLKGAGNSDAEEDEHELSMVEAVKDLEAVRESLKIRKWTFAGHSTGGMIGILYGIMASSSLNALIIVSAASSQYAESPRCIYNPDHPNFQKMQDLFEELKQPGLAVEKKKEIASGRMKLQLYKPENYQQYISPSVNKNLSSKRLNYFSIYEYGEFDLTDRLSEIKVPTLVICGKHDVACPAPYSEEINQGVQGSVLKLFKESNHYPFLEEKELFKETVEEFLETTLL